MKKMIEKLNADLPVVNNQTNILFIESEAIIIDALIGFVSGLIVAPAILGLVGYFRDVQEVDKNNDNHV